MLCILKVRQNTITVKHKIQLGTIKTERIKFEFIVPLKNTRTRCKKYVE